MIALNILLGNPISNEGLIALGKTVGADVPFCIMGNLYNYIMDNKKNKYTDNPVINNVEVDEVGLSSIALAEGIGEKLTPIVREQAKIQNGKSLENALIVLTKPRVYLSTKEIYSRLKLNAIQEHSNTKELIEDIINGNFNGISKNMINALESVTLKEYPIVMYTKNNMKKLGAEAILMSGSGPSIYGFFFDEKLAMKALEELKEKCPETYMVKIK
jgi:4-diphosphocytidyl-2-C-methyl-D-erythritol kinase